MTQKEMFPTAISSQRATPVSRSVSRESKKAQKMTATSGRTSLELLHKKDRLGAFSKTFMVTSPWASTKCCLTWKPKATPQGRLLFQLQVSTLPIEETDSGLWPTPTARDYKGARKPETLKAVGRDAKNSLPDAVRSGLWPTPRANKVHPMITEENREKLANRNKSNLEEVIAGEVGDATGQLNPIFVEWLMGYPEGWTDLKD